jgi:uncharacterized OB-fold protein
MNEINHSALISRTPETLPFWRAAAEGRLVLPLCKNCRQYHWYPRAVCPHCHGENLDWANSNGLGDIYSLAVLHRASPIETAAVVRLDEGICIYATARASAADKLQIGDRVHMVFESVSSECPTFVFRKVAD